MSKKKNRNKKNKFKNDNLINNYVKNESSLKSNGSVENKSDGNIALKNRLYPEDSSSSFESSSSIENDSLEDGNSFDNDFSNENFSLNNSSFESNSFIESDNSEDSNSSDYNSSNEDFSLNNSSFESNSSIESDNSEDSNSPDYNSSNEDFSLNNSSFESNSSIENASLDGDNFSDINANIENSNISLEDEQSSSYVMVKKSKSKKWIITLIIFVIIAALALVFCTIFGLLNLGNTNIISGTSISGIDVSGLSKEDAFEKVNSAFAEKLSGPITIKHNEYETSVFAEQFEINFDINSAIESAYNRGRTGNIFENNFTIFNSYFSTVNITPSFSYSDESIISLITEIEPNLPDRAIEPTYYVEGNNLIISKGVDGIIISDNELKGEIIYYFNNLLYKDPIIELPVENKTASKVDINHIHQEIYKAPQDAYYTSNPYVVHPHVDGVDFKISLEEATALLNAEGESCTIPLKILSPNVTTNQIGPEAFPDLLGQFSTTYSSSNYNRSTNIALAASKINGIVIMPGEVFSYNQTVGKRTAAAGFKTAGVYVNGQVSTGIGGGICQVSSTLYNAVLLANLEIVERTNHYFNPGYVEAGKDATVSWGGPDFRFKNNRNYPIKIVCSGTGGRVNFKVWGLHSDDDYEVVIESKYVQSIPYKTIQQKDASLAKGASKVIEKGSNGCKTETYKILKKNGTVISRTLISRDTYNPHNRIVAVN